MCYEVIDTHALLFAESDQPRLAAVLENLSTKQASEVMTQPAVTIEENKTVVEAVKLMLEKGVKRLPVVDKT